MRGALFSIVLGAVVLAALPAAARPVSAPLPQGQVIPVDTANDCLACHAAQRESATLGVHSQHGVRCVDCHGGDANARTLPDAHRGHFIGTPTKIQTALLCGSCHSDPNRMREYGLPIGQLAEFRTSRHGQLLFGKHDTDAPTCTDCHGVHIIYPPYDARSRVYPSNIPGTCAHCHSNDKLMAKYHLPTNQLEQFRNSAHGVALFQKHNFAAPTCISCHGAHSALPPTRTQIASVCGQCHALVDQAFNEGPHGMAARDGKLRGCLACHSNHGTERVPAAKISQTCDKCHAANSPAHQMGVSLQRRVLQAEQDMASAQSAIDKLSLAGRQVGYFKFRYESALTYYRQIAQAQHSLNLEKVDDLERRVRSVSIDLGDAASTSQEQTWEHKLLLAPVWFLSLSAVVLAWLTLRALRRRGDDHEDGQDRE